MGEGGIVADAHPGANGHRPTGGTQTQGCEKGSNLGSVVGVTENACVRWMGACGNHRTKQHVEFMRGDVATTLHSALVSPSWEAVLPSEKRAQSGNSRPVRRVEVLTGWHLALLGARAIEHSVQQD